MTRAGGSAGQASRAWNAVNQTYMRQVPQRWGADYEPAITSNTGKAPPGSTPPAVRSCRLGRTMHLLTQGETCFVALALFNPAVWDVHEQHILHPYPVGHPLASHPRHSHQPWPSTNGTLKILNGWGCVQRHPYVTKPAPTNAGHDGTKADLSAARLMRPWVGDLLVFINDEHGPYAVEWDVKDVSGRHGKPWAGDWATSNSPRSIAQAELRDRAYQRYMEELGIPIRRVAQDQVSTELCANLIRLLARNQTPLTIPQTQALEIESALQEALRTGETPARAIRRVVQAERAILESLPILECAIWERRLRVDLNREILTDRPLHPEKVDPLVEFAPLFAR